MRWLNILLTTSVAVAAPATAQLMSLQMDYPVAELRAGIQGTAAFAVNLGKDGKVKTCRITQSSGNANLDSQTCIQLRRTGRFKPALNPAGKPVASTYAGKLRWSIPSAAAAPE